MLILAGGLFHAQAAPEGKREVFRSQQPSSQSKTPVAKKVLSAPDYVALAKKYGGVVEPPSWLENAKDSKDALARLEKILGPVKFVQLAPLAALRYDLYSKAKANGYDDEKAAEIAMSTAGTIGQAASWYRNAAEQGDPWAQYNLGWLYKTGQGVPQDYAQAAVWWRKAADQGYARAQFNLGVSYDNGEGVSQNDEQAVFWYRKAADQGYAHAQYSLGLDYENGQGVPEDDAQAVAWYRKAADQGDADSQNRLAAIKERERDRDRILTIGIWLGCGGALAFLVGALAFLMVRYSRKLIGYSMKLIPRTTRAKQLAIVLPVASWCSACCLYQALDPRLIHHPVNAAITALLFSTPALIFGAVSLWWLSQAKKTD
ncbi:MAG: tetratricopeptide repeat protein [Acidobacteriaceae bacterium]